MPVTEMVLVSLWKFSNWKAALAAMAEDCVPKNAPVRASVATIPRKINAVRILVFIQQAKHAMA
ncbi:MAG TPA: hypothetical protein VJZ68_01190 [Nitrososphaera sp.]|nr:hypothetical protein [Nitrososphaera sp.]